MDRNDKRIILLPLILLLTVGPLIVHMYEYSTNFSQFDWYPITDEASDFFLYYKSVFITLVSAAMCAVLLWRLRAEKKEFHWGYQLLPLGIYAAWILLSTVFSQYKYFSIHGCMEMFETVWVVLGYCVMAFYAYQTLERLDFIMKWLTVGLGIMLTLGVFQAAGMDFFATKLGKMLITKSIYWDDLSVISIVFEKGRVFLTLYNPNFVASYFALMIPVEIALIVRNQKLAYRVLYAVMVLASVICLMASGNRSGIVAFAVTCLVAVFLLYRHILKAWKYVLPGVILVAIVLGWFISGNRLIIDKFARIFSQQAVEVEDDGISEIITGDEDVAITYHGETFHVAYEQQDDTNVELSMTDDEGKDVPYQLEEESGQYVLADERFPEFRVQLAQMGDSGIGIDVIADGYDWYFMKGDDGTYYYFNVYGRLDKINNAPRVAVKWLEQKFEERGTIWSKTIPMLKNSILFGTGADTYALVYPQDDYVDKTYDGSNGMIDVKPHCMYLQIAIQYGLPALLAFFALCGWYFVTGFCLYRKAQYENPMEIIGVGIYLALFTYLVAAVLNDSNVNVAPIFWILLGLGLAVNEMLQQEKA